MLSHGRVSFVDNVGVVPVPPSRLPVGRFCPALFVAVQINSRTPTAALHEPAPSSGVQARPQGESVSKASTASATEVSLRHRIDGSSRGQSAELLDRAVPEQTKWVNAIGRC